MTYNYDLPDIKKVLNSNRLLHFVAYYFNHCFISSSYMKVNMMKVSSSLKQLMFVSTHTPISSIPRAAHACMHRVISLSVD